MEESTKSDATWWGILLEFLRKPWVCISSAFLGLFIGLNFKDAAESIAPIGDIYMKLLTMTVTPIVFSALAIGITHLLESKNGSRYIGRTLAALATGTLIAGFLGTFLALAAAPHLKPDTDKRDFIGEALSSIEKTNAAQPETKPGVLGFIQNFIPSNVVDALASDNLLAVVFLATLLGVALCNVTEGRRLTALGLFSAIYETFIIILEWILYLLPFGLCCLLASQASKVGLEALKAMSAIIGIYMLCFLAMSTLYLAALRQATGKSLREVWTNLKEPFTIAFIASSDSALPSAMRKMEKFGYPKEMLNSVIPLSSALNRHGTATVFAITTIFVAQIYGMELTVWKCLLIALSCSVVGAFDSGEYVTIAPMITYILIPLGLPPAGAVAIILTIWPMFEWFPELQCTMASCANAAIVGNLNHAGESSVPSHAASAERDAS